MSEHAVAPFAAGSISLRLYPHDHLSAEETVTELREQAALAVRCGFDGVMTSEHHGGFPGYLPNPLQVAGWLLESMESGWAAASPLLLTLRPPALVIEETAWLAARFPGRVGLGVAAGSLESDFTIMGLDKAAAMSAYGDGLAVIAAALSGRDFGSLSNDPVVQARATSPIPVLSAANSATAARRAAACGVGLLFDSMSDTARCRSLVDTYRDAGGDGPVVLIRRAWLGAPPTELQEQQMERYRSYTPDAAQEHWSGDARTDGSAQQVAEQLSSAKEAVGADALNIRLHLPGVTPAAVREQIEGIAEVVRLLKP